MTRHATRSLPGTRLLALAAALFDDEVIRRVVHPTVADLQNEWQHATGPLARATARWRGYRAFWMLVLIAPVAFWDWPVKPSGAVAFPDRVARVAAAAIVLVVALTTWFAAGAWTLLPLAGGSLLAVIIHRWQLRHPSIVVVPDRAMRPGINVSAIPVGGDAGGLIFVVGSVAIVVAALPFTRWFLLGVIIGGLASAWAIHRWRATHVDATASLAVGR